MAHHCFAKHRRRERCCCRYIPKKGDYKPFREKFFRQRLVLQEEAQYDLRELIVLKDLDSWVMTVHEKRPDPLPPTPRQPPHLPPIPPPKSLAPGDAMKLWYHLQHEGDDSEFWHNVWRGATPSEARLTSH